MESIVGDDPAYEGDTGVGQGAVSATFVAGGEGSGSTNLTRTEHWNANLANKTIGSS